MPRMSKKRKQEWALFPNERNRITYNELCRKRQHDCKQSFRVMVIECPNSIKTKRITKWKTPVVHQRKGKPADL